MRFVAFSIYAILCVIMAAATFVENIYGTEFTHEYIYGSWWFCLLWAVAIVTSIPCIPKHFRRIWRKKNTLLLLALLSPLFPQPALSASPRHIGLPEAETMKYQQVEYNGRFCPLNTVARDFTQKITGSHTFSGMTAEQVLVSWCLYPDEWKSVRMIKVKKTAALKELGIAEKTATFSEFFDSEGNYRLKRGAYPDIEDKLTVIIMATQGELFEPMPQGVTPLSDTKVEAEIFYNRVNWNLILFIGCFTLAILSFILRGKVSQRGTLTLSLCLWATLLTAILLRWYVAEHLPLTNTFETMQLVALAAMTLACMSHTWRGYAMIVAGATLLVTHISSLDPAITRLMPALNSPWLSSHVTTIMISYALYAMLLFRPNRGILIWAEILLGTGIILGSIWAKSAWGTYWNWDPKETWALITLIVYMYPLHAKSLPWFRNKTHLTWYLRAAFLTVLMTYFGCNYLLTGMHSYAQ